jgi:hypothetical protein
MGAIGFAAFGCAGIGATPLAAERFVRRRAARICRFGIHQALPANAPGRTQGACVRVRRDRDGGVSQTNRLTNASDSTDRASERIAGVSFSRFDADGLVVEHRDFSVEIVHPVQPEGL